MNIKIEPRKTTDRGGYLMLPLIKNIPYPANDTWKKEYLSEVRFRVLG